MERRISIHEAGHAVAGRLVGLPSGDAFLDPPHAEFAIDQGAASVVALMGGAIGEVLHFGDYDATGIRVDWERAEERLAHLGYEDGGAALWAYTHDLLAPYAGLIKCLAVKLERDLVLDGAVVDRLIGFRG